MVSKISMEAILALSTEWLDWVAISCELWRICTGPILFWCWLKGYSMCKNTFIWSSINWLWIENTLPRFCNFLLVAGHVQSCQHVCGCSGQVFVCFFCAFRSVKDQTFQGVSEHLIFIFLFAMFLFFCLSVTKKTKSLSTPKVQFLQVCDCGGCCVCVSPPFFCLAVVAGHAAVDVRTVQKKSVFPVAKSPKLDSVSWIIFLFWSIFFILHIHWYGWIHRYACSKTSLHAAQRITGTAMLYHAARGASLTQKK